MEIRARPAGTAADGSQQTAEIGLRVELTQVQTTDERLRHFQRTLQRNPRVHRLNRFVAHSDKVSIDLTTVACGLTSAMIAADRLLNEGLAEARVWANVHLSNETPPPG